LIPRFRIATDAAKPDIRNVSSSEMLADNHKVPISVKEKSSPMSSFPRTLADLKPGEDSLVSSSQSFYGSLKELRKSTLSMPNRLGSIAKDADFVRDVAAAYKLPVIANERCGSWYVPPELKAGSAYFKSTDGHTGQWMFSLRRLNLQVFDIIGQHGGCILVDSTRRGKTMPDAFSKTVPIWCAVMNRALFPEEEQFHHSQLSGVELSASETAQIEGRLDGFLRAFQDLGLDREALKRRLGRPMVLQWVVGHSTDALPAVDRNSGKVDSPCHRVILCSASRRVQGAEMLEGGYIQGAGDDSESWSQDMTPQIFWTHKNMLFQAQKDELPDMIRKLTLEEGRFRKPQRAVLIEPTSNIYITSWTENEDGPYSDSDLTINCHSHESATHDASKRLNLKCGSGKRGSRDLRHKLHDVRVFAASALERNPACRIFISCETGKDLSVGVALILLCLLYWCDGRCIYECSGTDTTPTSGMAQSFRSCQQIQKIDKGFIRQRLAWITSSKPDANPSRSTLQSLHAYLMERP
jgi:tRNA A64-2'-O-ribosylphosphate transferase